MNLSSYKNELKERMPRFMNRPSYQPTIGVIDRLSKLQGKEFKYSALCRALGIQAKTGNSKVYQLENLQNYCRLVTLQNPTRYMIDEVYPEADALINELGKDSYQAAFEAAIYQIFLKTNCADIYASTSNLLIMFKEINSNFNYTYSQAVATSQRYRYMAQANEIVFDILARWTRDRLQTMHERRVIDLSRGYRLYSKRVNADGKQYMATLDVADTSELHKTCMSIYSNAIADVMPPEWGNVVNGIRHRPFVPIQTYRQFQARLAELVKAEFEGIYETVKEVYIIKPSTKEWITSRLLDVYKHYPSFERINEKACLKIIQTSQLNCITGEQRREFIDVNMTVNPTIDLRQEIKKERA